MINKIALGTAQFGLNYGIANTAGQTSLSEVSKILALAKKSGINLLDTAIAYGESESVLGQQNIETFDIVTKLPECPKKIKNVSLWIEEEVSGSFSRLKRDRLFGLLLHRPSQLLEPIGKEIYSALTKLKQDGFFNKIGISVYDPKELTAITNQYAFDIVQLPYNIFDSRWDKSLDKLKQKGVEVHVRSAFLQGLILMSANTRPKKFERWIDLWRRWDEWCVDNHLTPLQASLSHILERDDIDSVIVGVDSERQLNEILNSVVSEIPSVPSKLKTSDPLLLNPSNWNNL